MKTLRVPVILGMKPLSMVEDENFIQIFKGNFILITIHSPCGSSTSDDTFKKLISLKGNRQFIVKHGI